MKIHWGTGIAIGYSLFAGSMIFLAVCSTRHPHNLVREDYYQADLAYQARYERMVNERERRIRVRHRAGEDGILLINVEPTEIIDGRLTFFRPNDPALDFTLTLCFDATGRQWIPTGALAAGRWTLQLDYHTEEKGYYSETQILL